MQLWLASSLRLVAVSSVSATLIHILIVVVPTDTLLRAIGKRANALHVNAYFSSQCVLISAIGYVPRVGLFPYYDDMLVAHPSMRIFQIPPVIPTRVLTLVLIFLVGIFGSIGQVYSTLQSFILIPDVNIAKTLLAMGFQQETASRGSLAMYTSVCLPYFYCFTGV